MPINFVGRSLLTFQELSTVDIDFLLNLASSLKAKKYAGIPGNLLTGKNVALVFNLPSTRTRCAFEVAAYDENGKVTYLSHCHLGYKESLEDTAKILGRYYDGIGFRGYHHSEVEILAKYAGVPVWNGLTSHAHPTQILADLLTVREHTAKPLHKIKWVYVGDARNNVARSLMVGAAKLGMNFVGLAPRAFWPNQTLATTLQEMAVARGGRISLEEDLGRAVEAADVIYTDAWMSLGEEPPSESLIEQLTDYRVTHQMLEQTGNKDVIFMHCLPAIHDANTQFAQIIQKQYGITEMEVTDEVFRGRHSVILDQAENRLHTIKAIMVASIGRR